MVCYACGKEATKSRFDLIPEDFRHPKDWSGRDKYRAYCDECFAAVLAEEKKEREEYIRLKKRQMLRAACENLEKQGVDMYVYKDAIEAVEEVMAEKPDNFDSSYEVIAAIMLVHNRIRAKMQYKVAGYQVDFLLPERRVVLEIDGDRHKHRKAYDSARDEKIKRELGRYFEIVRIKTEYLDKKAEALPTAIDAVIASRKKGHINWRELYD